MIEKAVRSGNVHHLLIFVGRSSETLTKTAYSLAAAWLGQTDDPISLQSCPDFLICRCEGKIAFHSAASIRSLLEELSFRPFKGGRRVALILDGERMLPSGSNALLKSLEEPTSGTLFIITSTVVEKILPTIRSRGQIVRIPSSETESKIELPKSLDELTDIFWDTNPAALVDRIYQVSKQIEKEIDEEKERRKKERASVLEQLPKSLRQEVENELEGEIAKYAQDLGRATLEKLWCIYRSRLLQTDCSTLPNPFQSTFGSKGIFAQALLALDRGMPLSSALIMLLNPSILK